MIIIIFLAILTIMALTQNRILYLLEKLDKLPAEIEENKKVMDQLFMEVRKQGRRQV